MDLRQWLQQWLAAPQPWQRDWNALDREYRAGRISVEQYMYWKERIREQEMVPIAFRKVS
jgi:hypothetical protein